METFNVTRVFTDKNGESRFEDLFYQVHDKGGLGDISVGIRVKEIFFKTVTLTNDALHNAPNKQYVVLLDGSVEIETSLGEKKVFKAGDVLLMEDVTGKGHRSRNIVPKVQHSLFITFEETPVRVFKETCL